MPVRTYQIMQGRVSVTPDEGQIRVYCKPTDQEIEELMTTYQIQRHDIDSALDPDETGRFEFEDDHINLIFKRPCNYSSADNFLFRVMSSGIFIFQDKLIIVLGDDIPVFTSRTSKINTLHDAVLRVIQETIRHFIGHLRVISMISDELEKKIEISMENKLLMNMFTIQKSLVFFLSALTDNARVLNKLKSMAGKIGFTEDNLEIISDISIDNSQCLALTQMYSDILSSLMNARNSMVGNNLNIMMKNLNAIVIAIAIPSFIAGVGGMSEFSMMTGTSHWLISYPLFLLSMMALGVLIFLFIQKWDRLWK